MARVLHWSKGPVAFFWIIWNNIRNSDVSFRPVICNILGKATNISPWTVKHLITVPQQIAKNKSLSHRITPSVRWYHQLLTSADGAAAATLSARCGGRMWLRSFLYLEAVKRQWFTRMAALDGTIQINEPKLKTFLRPRQLTMIKDRGHLHFASKFLCQHRPKAFTRMSTDPGYNLPAELSLMVLLELTSSQDVYSFMRTSRSIYRLFQRHQVAILAETLKNAISPHLMPDLIPAHLAYQCNSFSARRKLNAKSLSSKKK